MSTKIDILDIWKDRRISIPKDCKRCLKYCLNFIIVRLIIWWICRYIMFLPKH